MTSVECYTFGTGLLNQPASGNLPVRQFEEFFNRAQVEKLGQLVENGLDASMMGEESVSPFFVNRAVPLTNGIGAHNPSRNLAFGPTLWSSGYRNPACGETNTGDPPMIPVPVLKAKGWADRSMNLIDITNSLNPCARILDETRIEVRPRALRFVQCWYVRYPRKIVVGSIVDPDGIVRPQEGAPNQVDPEWSDIDTIDIIWIAMGYTGLSLQSDRMQATAARKEKAA